jgi:hypothetical protein
VSTFITLVLFHLVLAFYSQGGGKSPGHSWQSTSRTIGAVSYLAVQTYEQFHHTVFRAVHHAVAALQVFTFIHLPSDYFLSLLPGSVSLSADRRSLEVDASGLAVFRGLQAGSRVLVAACKELQQARRKGRKRAKDPNSIEDEVEDED